MRLQPQFNVDSAGKLLSTFRDVMLDHFIVGSVDRISPEAPVPVVRFAREDYRLGGAANVANNIRTLGAAVELIALAGQDAEAERLRHELADAEADPSAVGTR